MKKHHPVIVAAAVALAVYGIVRANSVGASGSFTVAFSKAEPAPPGTTIPIATVTLPAGTTPDCVVTVTTDNNESVRHGTNLVVNAAWTIPDIERSVGYSATESRPVSQTGLVLVLVGVAGDGSETGQPAGISVTGLVALDCPQPPPSVPTTVPDTGSTTTTQPATTTTVVSAASVAQSSGARFTG